ncbi:hypothetical protein GCM10023321_10830 [Pseudonocardia eucalypti]|uniref:Uncharacterized protein n=1 Tax=Pseudonocardia eucalypti TaxID=648755 RepID=A0ABP9PPG8_9PSEU|nr:hypothetical protein [Pseudonocardia eucalypti]
MTTGWYDLGDVTVVPIVETPRLLIAPAEFFPGTRVDRDEWCFQQPWFDAATGSLVYAIRSYCVDPAAAARARNRLLAGAAASGTPIVPTHFAHPAPGRVTPTTTGYTFRPASDLLRKSSSMVVQSGPRRVACARPSARRRGGCR